ncbi:Avirulence protein (Avh) [Phytophthora palmivora]|uniref:Avirulence protein (Avh) n=1 Tax=Phytophthora palmivora TaxID=4796 RepID=A0A2P4YUB8_9STRA|nr:Avirulence protein (Avh) [Phytophthora palmivora]
MADTVKLSASKLKKAAQTKFSLFFDASEGVVLKNLKLGNDIEAALKSKRINTLFENVNQFNARVKPSKRISAVSSLMKKYGDDVVIKAVASAKLMDDTKGIATKLETELVNGWMQQKKNVDQVFSILKIQDNMPDALRIQKIEILENFISLYNRRTYQDKHLVQVLTRGFGSDKYLLSSLGAAKSDIRVAEKATDLETAVLVQKVQRHIDGGLDSIMNSQSLSRLDRYVSKMRKAYGNNDVTLVESLVAKYGHERIAKALVDAKSVESSKQIATKLQTQLYETWLKQGMSVDYVFDLMQLKQLGENVVSSRGLDVLEDYVSLVNSKLTSNNAHENFIKTLSKGFKGDDKFTYLLQEASKKPKLEDQAVQLQNKLFQQWREDRLDAASIFPKIFKTDEETAFSWMKTISSQFKQFLESPA